jgi:hypothetical protein
MHRKTPMTSFLSPWQQSFTPSIKSEAEQRDYLHGRFASASLQQLFWQCFPKEQVSAGYPGP